MWGVLLCVQGTNLLIPLHGYPVMNETKFPKRVDFGVGKVCGATGSVSDTCIHMHTHTHSPRIAQLSASFLVQSKPRKSAWGKEGERYHVCVRGCVRVCVCMCVCVGGWVCT